MRMRWAVVTGLAPILALILAPADGRAQEHTGHSEHAGKEERDIKALSPERIQELLDGAGAGYALPAELNGYPGPRHVLELGPELSLGEDQRARVQAVFDGMQEEARALGRRLVDAEADLERAFRGGAVTPSELRELTGAAAALEGELRLVHLSAHIRTRDILTASQIERYDALRGYATALPPE